MPKRGYKQTSEHIAKCAAAKVDKPGWSKGLTKETDPRVAANSAAQKGTSPWNKGLTKETNPRVAKQAAAAGVALKGRKAWNVGLTKETDPRVAANGAAVSVARKGKSLSAKHCAALSAVRKGRSCPWMVGESSPSKRPDVRAKNSAALKELWQEPVFIANHIKAQHARPNKPEKFLTKLFDSLFPGKMSYTGSGDFMVGRYNPDFVNVDEKKIIEFFGDYWHQGEDPQEKINYYAQYGYQTLIIWERELKNIDTVCEKVTEFIAK